MQADTGEGKFNGPVSPSTVRKNIEVRFLFYSIARGLGDGEKDKKTHFKSKMKKRPADVKKGRPRMFNI